MSGPELVLASASEARRTILENAGVPFRICPADIDERAIKADGVDAGQNALGIAAELASAKAAVVSARCPDSLVLGCDQVLEQDGIVFDKPNDANEARRHLETFSGRSHRLVSALALTVAGSTERAHTAEAVIGVRRLSRRFIENYISVERDRLMGSVGGYRLEGPGVQLFSRIEGDYFTILGLPLLPLLEELRRRRVLAS